MAGVVTTLKCVFVTSVLLGAVFGEESDYISYTIADDLPGGRTVANIIDDSHLSSTYSREVLQQLSYVFLTQGIHLDYFRLDELSGEISSVQTVDRDVICPTQPQCAMRLDIAVQPSKYFEIIKVVIHIEDRNDNSPIFQQDSVSYELSESTSPGIALVPIATAKDIDSPKFGVIRYSLQSDTDVFGLNAKNSSSGFEVHLTLNSELDRETEDHYRLYVLAIDGGSPARTGTLTINVHILDINDNHPKFESSTYEVNVPENLTPGRSIITIKATDDDIGKNGHILYSFNPKTVEEISGTFTIERSTGMIYLEKPLDYEEKQFYSLMVVAKDEGPNSLPANTRVLINVVDVNDNSPVIIMNTLPENQVVEIKENKPPEVIVVHISILDDDSGTNGHVECFLSGHDGKFQIVEMYDKEFKIVTIEKLDREEQAGYELWVECKDYGQPQLKAKESISIKVVDVNDNAPEFSQRVYSAVIVEHSTPGQSLVKVKATDRDSGNNGLITYSIDKSMSNEFQIDENTGEIKTKIEFDRELTEHRTFQVTASDNGDKPQSSTAKVKISILDIDDNVPRFMQHKYHMNISENLPPHSIVGWVKAQDADSEQHNTFTYYLEGRHSGSGVFMVDSSGRIDTRRVLDREKQSKYTLVMTVQSDHSPNKRDSAEIEITVLDTNDNAPIFTFPSAVTNTTWLSSRAPAGSLVTTLTAADNDSQPNNQLTYRITAGNDDDYFELQPKTGIILLKRDISFLHSVKLHLRVMVEDSGQPPKMDTATLYIVINTTIPAAPIDSIDPESVKKVDEVTGDLLAVIVGCVSGAVVIMLAVLLAVIVFMRRRKQCTARQVSWYTAHPPTTPSTNHLVTSSDDGNGSNDSSSPKLVPHNLADVDMKDKTLSVMTNSDFKSHIHYVPPAPLLKSGTFSDDKDNDSGCADLSQGSNDDHLPNTTSNIYDARHQRPAQKHTATSQIKDPYAAFNRNNHHYHNNHTHHQPQKTPDEREKQEALSRPNIDPMSSPSSRHHNVSPRHESERQEALSRPYIDPIPPSSRHHNVSPRLQKSFADWLNSEGDLLQNTGHKYRVSQRQSGSQTLPASPRAASVKKTVRFTEPDDTRQHQGMCSHENTPRDTQRQFKPSKSDNNLYSNVYPPPMETIVRHYGSLDKRRYNSVEPRHKKAVVKFSDYGGDDTDGSLV